MDIGTLITVVLVAAAAAVMLLATRGARAGDDDADAVVTGMLARWWLDSDPPRVPAVREPDEGVRWRTDLVGTRGTSAGSATPATQPVRRPAPRPVGDVARQGR